MKGICEGNLKQIVEMTPVWGEGDPSNIGKYWKARILVMMQNRKALGDRSTVMTHRQFPVISDIAGQLVIRTAIVFRLFQCGEI